MPRGTTASRSSRSSSKSKPTHTSQPVPHPHKPSVADAVSFGAGMGIGQGIGYSIGSNLSRLFWGHKESPSSQPESSTMCETLMTQFSQAHVNSMRNQLFVLI